MSKVRVIACAQAANGKSKELEAALRAMLAPTRQEEGCNCYELYRSQHGADFYFYEEWASEEALDAHNKSAHIARLKEQIPDLVAKPMAVSRLNWEPLQASE